MFERGDLTEANALNMMEFEDEGQARDTIVEMAGAAPTNEPGNKVSPTVTILPFNRFAGAQREATISINLDPTADRDGTKVYRASANNGWSYVALDTQIIDGKAVAQTDQGGIFVAAAEVSTGTIVGVVVAAFVLILVAVLVVGLIVYFRTQPDRWQSTKEKLSQTQNRLKRSFAKQV